MVSAAVYEPEPKEGEDGWSPDLFKRDDGKFYRTIYVAQLNEAGERMGWGKRKKNWFPKYLPDAIVWLQSLWDQIPEAHRGETYFRIDSEDIGSYDEWHVATLELAYVRPATDDEIARYNKKCESETATRISQELKELERLKKKYGR
jgi:hypothetical protein